jgi:hypothetical protein
MTMNVPAPNETPAQRAERLRNEALAAKKTQLDIAQAAPAQIASEADEAVSSVEAQQRAGAAQIRRAGAEQLSQTLGGAPRTGSGARLAAARSLGQRGITAEADAGMVAEAQKSSLRAAAAKDMRAAELNATQAKLDNLEFQKEAGTPQEDLVERRTNTLDAINKQVDDYLGVFNDNEEGLANMIMNEALKIRDMDPVLYEKLTGVAFKVRQRGAGGIDVGPGWKLTANLVA